MAESIYKRILIKLSGEALMGSKPFGIEADVVKFIAKEIGDVRDLGVEIGAVIGGGNIFRGLSAGAQGFDRVIGDQMGMLATVINSLALQNSLEQMGIHTRIQTAIRMEAFAEPYIRRRAIRHLEKGRIVIFAAGTGSPYFSTDTAAALRAIEIEAGAILKGTRVDGVYAEDPEKVPNAERFKSISYIEVLNRELRVMDYTAITLCMENKMPIAVFNMTVAGNFKRFMLGEEVGTIVMGDQNEK